MKLAQRSWEQRPVPWGEVGAPGAGWQSWAAHTWALGSALHALHVGELLGGS